GTPDPKPTGSATAPSPTGRGQPASACSIAGPTNSATPASPARQGQSASVPPTSKPTRSARRRARLSVDLGPLDHEGHAHVGPVLVQVLAPDARRDDVYGADVAKRCLCLLERLHRRVVGGRLRAPDELDDLHNCHFLCSSPKAVDGR